MFAAIYQYETTAWLKKPGFYLFMVTFFLFPFLLFVGTGGYFDTLSYDGSAPLFINSPYQVNNFLQYIGKFLLFLLPAIIGTTIHKDFRHDAYQLLFSYPVAKGVYLSAKLLSALSLVILISAMPFLAFIAGESLLGVDNPYITTTDLDGYIFSYGYILLPNLVVFGTMVFGMVALSRNIYAGFIFILLLVIYQVAIENLFNGSSFFAGLLDPFGQQACQQQTRFWTLSEKNTLSLSVSDALLYNRMVWIAIASGVGLFTITKFSLSHFGWSFGISPKKPKKVTPSIFGLENGTVGGVRIASGFVHSLRQCYTMVRHEVGFVLRNWIFIAFCFTGIVLLIFMLQRVLHSNEVVMLPLTRLILLIPAFFYNHIVVFATFIFAGMIVLRARDSQMEPLIHSTAIPTWTLVVSKAVSLILIQNFLLILLMVTGICIQILNGHDDLDFYQYFTTLLLFQTPVLAVWAFLSVGVFSIVRHLYSGLFFLILAWFAQFGYDQLGITTKLLQFNTYPLFGYSDINGFGHEFLGRLVLQAYWLLWGFVALFVAIQFWPRVLTTSLKERWRLPNTHSSPDKSIIFGILFILLSSFIYFIFKAENQIIKISESNQVVDDFEAKFSSLRDLAQPRITSVSMKVDLFPEENRFRASGEYTLVNKTEKPIDTILIKTSMDEITSYQFAAENQLIDSFPLFNFSVHKLNRPLMPGDSMRLTFTIENQPNTLFQKNSGVLENGTFLTHDILPRIGYFLRQHKPTPWDANIPDNHYHAWDSDLVDFQATLSTSGHQIALTNGNHIKHWQEGGRNYSSYQTAAPVKFSFHFNSGEYNLYHDHWNDTPIIIYHHPHHTHNLQAIASGVKCALEFNSQLFGFAPQEEIRIIEYPLSEGSFSTLKTNAIVMSESVFGVNTQYADKINLPFYVAAHEMTHHWFGNKLMPKDAKGALLLTESITEYLTLQVFKEEFGEKKALEFLKVQHQRYFSGRADESSEENSLCMVDPGQAYIAYGKGTVALNAISQTLGPKNFLKLLSDFFNRYQNAASYPTSIDFLETLKMSAPDSSLMLIEELLLKSVVYDIEIVSGELEQTGKNEWTIKMDYYTQAYEKGEPIVEANQTYMKLGIYNSNGELIKAISLSTKDHQKVITLTSTSIPHQLILDPDYLILDKERGNNRRILF